MKKINEKLFGNYVDENDKPNILGGAELVPYVPTDDVNNAMANYFKNIKEALAVRPEDWPEGRTVTFTLIFALVPTSFETKFGQE